MYQSLSPWGVVLYDPPKHRQASFSFLQENGLDYLLNTNWREVTHTRSDKPTDKKNQILQQSLIYSTNTAKDTDVLQFHYMRTK